MSTATKQIEELANTEYKYGFVTDVEQDIIPVGLDEDVVRLISSKKGEPQWLLDWRLKAFRAWLKMNEPHWQNVTYAPIDYQGVSYYAAPSEKKKLNSLDEVDPEIRATFDKLGIPIEEQKLLSNVAVDAVFDSVSVATTFRSKLAELGHHLLLVLRGGEGSSRPGRSSTSARSCRTPTTISPRSTRRCSATAASSTSRRARAARWSCRPTSASTPRTPASSSAR